MNKYVSINKLKTLKYGCLLLVKSNSGISRSRIGEHMSLKRSTTSQFVERVLNKGYIERKSNKNAAAVHTLCILPGKEANALMPEVKAHEAEPAKLYSPGEYLQLMDLLLRLIT